MNIIPAIDIQSGKAVRLQQGQFDRLSEYTPTPAELAKRYADQGINRLHIVDLDGAKSGTLQQLDLIKDLQQPGLALQIGGGIRSLGMAQNCLDAGIDKLVIGSIAVSNPDLTCQIINLAGPKRIVLALDINMQDGIPKPAIHAWQTPTSQSLWDLVEHYQTLGITQVLCTDIACDGMMGGPNFGLYQQAVTRFPAIAWQASGGIRNRDDIKALADLGVSAVILGRMLYESDVCLKALQSC